MDFYLLITRNNIEAGDITGEDIFYVLPFGNLIDKLTLK